MIGPRGQMVIVVPTDRREGRMSVVNGRLLYKPIRCTYCGRLEPKGLRVLSAKPFQWGLEQHECCNASTLLPFFPPTYPHRVMRATREKSLEAASV